MARTKTEEALLAAEEAHADDPERAELLARARRFKSSWIELGEALSLARKSGSFKRWGYGSLEDYAKAELFLRADTVEKLTGSFMFLKKSAPEVLERSGTDARIPSYQAVDFLRRAEAQADAPEESRRRDSQARDRGRCAASRRCEAVSARSSFPAARRSEGATTWPGCETWGSVCRSCSR